MKKKLGLAFSTTLTVLIFSCIENAPKAINKNESSQKAILPSVLPSYSNTNVISDNSINNTNLNKYITKGLAKTDIENLLPCQGSRVSAVGSITSNDNKTWVVPAINNYYKNTKAYDLYNDCNNFRPKNINEINLASLNTIEIDKDGEVITGFIFADNYFELYINGKLLAVDPVPFTPFNSSIVKFKAKKPITYAIKLIDWEENLGLGTEDNHGNKYHSGDGGFIAKFSDGTVTNSKWKAQSFYISPLEDTNCVKDSLEGKHDSSSCKTEVNCTNNCQAIHYTLPDNWFKANFDDSKWEDAKNYTENEIGVDNKPAYMNFKQEFSGANFIWSNNLILDNEVIIRYTNK
ncbi:MAG: hypothetical protein U0457_09580 [Candidatus Sericytochromatia bacterium]